MGYRLIDHTADLGIRVQEPDGPRLFTVSAQALFDLLWDPRFIRSVNTGSQAFLNPCLTQIP